jgi:LysM repeat protein
MKPIVPLLLILILLSGCLVQSEPLGGDFLSSLTCQQVAAHANASMACIPTVDGLLLQTEDQQISLRTETAVLTFDSTVYWMQQGAQMQVVVLDGVASFTSDGVTRVIRGGQGVEVGGNASLITVGAPSVPSEPSRDALIGLPISNLPRPLDRQTVQSPAIPTTTPMPTLTAVPNAPTSTPDTVMQQAEVDTSNPSAPISPTALPDCTLPAGWDTVYHVQAGDTLTQISVQHDVSVADIIAANCITNPDRLALNQEIRLPGGVVTGETTFTAERDVILAGDCVVLSWSAVGGVSVSLGGVPVSASGTQSVCPTQTQTYELIVIGADGQQSTYSQTITVTQ